MDLPKEILNAKRWTIANAQKTPLDAAIVDTTSNINTGWSPEEYNSKLYSFDQIQTIIKKHPDVILYPAFRNFRKSGYLCVDIDDKSKTDSPYLRLPYIYFEKSLSGRGYHGIVPYHDTDLNIHSINKDKDWNVDLFLEDHFMTFYNLPLHLDLKRNLKIANNPKFQVSLQNQLKKISAPALNMSGDDFFGNVKTQTDISKYTDRPLEPIEEATIQRIIRNRLRYTYRQDEDKSVKLASYLAKAGFSLHAKREFNKYSFYKFLALLMFVAEHKTPKREKFTNTFNSSEIGFTTWLQYAVYNATRFVFDELDLTVNGSKKKTNI